MATLYQYDHYLTKSTSGEFDKLYTPGTSTPYSGVYRCEGCGDAVASNSGNPLPPQNHHQHTPTQGTIRWRLIVWA